MQFYKATSNGIVDDEDIENIRQCIEAAYNSADYIGSLVVGTLEKGARIFLRLLILLNPINSRKLNNELKFSVPLIKTSREINSPALNDSLKANMSPTILVTGASGNVGREVLRSLKDKPATIRIASRSLVSLGEQQNPNSVYLDFEDPTTYLNADGVTLYICGQTHLTRWQCLQPIG